MITGMGSTMTVLLTGGSGLLGTALREVFADCNVVAPTSAEVDVTDPNEVEHMIATIKPRLILHAAALSNVDICELEPERAYRINARGCENIARSAAHNGARMIMISTDYVFSGDSLQPYAEDDEPGPRCVYGASKLAGEYATAFSCPNHVIARVSWLYGKGRTCFVDSLVAWGRDQGPPVRVAGDQVSVPSSARSVARGLRNIAACSYQGIVHVTNQGGASRYELARAVWDGLSLTRGLEAGSMAEFAAPARRPPQSQLDNRVLADLGMPPLPPWRDDLNTYLTETYGA